MANINLKNIGRKIEEKRADMGLREAAKIIGVSPATLSRIENGKIPDLDTFSKLCKWLELDPGNVMGVTPKKQEDVGQVKVHFKKDDAVHADTAQALANMIMAAQRALLSRQTSKA
jgi:transcriptional regulator with XRE-family HTH domain